MSEPVSLGDIVTAMFARPSNPKAEDDEPSDSSSPPPAEARQITPATPEQLVAIKELAASAADLFDEIEELVGSKAVELGAKKQALRELMLAHGMKEIEVPGRPPVELNTKRDKKPTKKAITAILGPEKGAELWAKLPAEPSHYVTIPPRTNTEA